MCAHHREEDSRHGRGGLAVSVNSDEWTGSRVGLLASGDLMQEFKHLSAAALIWSVLSRLCIQSGREYAQSSTQDVCVPEKSRIAVYRCMQRINARARGEAPAHNANR